MESIPENERLANCRDLAVRQHARQNGPEASRGYIDLLRA
jgi:hypothetical protein